MMLPLMSHATAFDQRPIYHFTAPEGWINDPNGLVFANGKYHLFYQHNPFGTRWGNMTWGHATSKDLIHWKHLGEAIRPDSMGTIFSGSAVVDKSDTAGFGKNAIICAYTSAGGTNDESKGQPFTQSLAWSTDGSLFHKFAGNPVLPNIVGENRDPRLIWHEASKKWVMALYLSGSEFGFYGSRDLRSWTPLSQYTLHGSSECPDLFVLPLDGNKRDQRWVFSGADGKYQVGNFNGQSFVPETAVLESYFGNTAYAAQTFSNAPKGRIIHVSWFRGSDFLDQKWNQQMSVPNEITLKTTRNGPKLFFTPVAEIVNCRQMVVTGPTRAEALDIEGRWDLPESGKMTLHVKGVDVTVDAAERTVTALGKVSHFDAKARNVHLRILVDRASLEVYVQGGEAYMPFWIPPSEPSKHEVTVSGNWAGSSKVFELKV